MVIICVINYVRSMLYTFQMARTPFSSLETFVKSTLEKSFLFFSYICSFCLYERRGKGEDVKYENEIFSFCVPNHEIFRSTLKISLIHIENSWFMTQSNNKEDEKITGI
jgi:hypothetical protein